MEKIKFELYQLCCLFLNNRFKIIQNTINEIQESLTSETKSTAGDKHETGRAMLQIEREKAGNQLAEIQKTKETLTKINPSNISKNIGLGSVVYTNKRNYFIAISAGEFTINKDKFYAISPSTPIGKLLIGKRIGDKIEFRKECFKIQQVF